MLIRYTYGLPYSPRVTYIQESWGRVRELLDNGPATEAQIVTAIRTHPDPSKLGPGGYFDWLLKTGRIKRAW